MAKRAAAKTKLTVPVQKGDMWCPHHVRPPRRPHTVAAATCARSTRSAATTCRGTCRPGQPPMGTAWRWEGPSRGPEGGDEGSICAYRATRHRRLPRWCLGVSPGGPWSGMAGTPAVCGTRGRPQEDEDEDVRWMR